MKEIVIKIPEDAYDYLINTSFVEDPKIMFNQSVKDRKHTMHLFEVIDAVKNGTPLPEHHGRLIDADDLMKVYSQFEFSSDMGDAMEILDHTPTIIEGSESE